MAAETNGESSSYRNVQTSFISNLNGTTTLEISLVTSFTPVSVILRSLLWQILAGNRENLEGIFPTGSGIIFVLEYLTLVLPTFLAFTLLADYSVFIFIILLLFLATTGLFFHNAMQNVTLSAPMLDKKKRFLCNFRAYVNIATAISILAVDFVIYPRRFAKTETYGTGLMDVGVGSFMFANAVVCQDARGTTASAQSFVKAVKKELRAVFILLGLGLIRFSAVKTTDYQEHVSEYGVHWNFFLTLAFVRVLSTIILRILPQSLEKRPWIIGLLIGLFYQRALVYGLEDFVLSGSKGDGSRSNFIDANREGICSSFGYIALYFIGVSIGKLIFHKYSCFKSLLKLLSWLICIAVLCWSMLWYWGNTCMSDPERIISRRLANFPFVLWQVGYNVQLLATFLAVDILMVALTSTLSFLRYPGGCWSCSSTADSSHDHNIPSLSIGSSQEKNLLHSAPQPDSSHTIRSRKLGNKSTFSQVTDTKNDHAKESNSPVTKAPTVKDRFGCTCLISAVNYNLLAYFLIANLLTGAVNLSMETINASQTTAFVIMNVYLLVLHAVITVFYRHNILLKL